MHVGADFHMAQGYTGRNYYELDGVPEPDMALKGPGRLYKSTTANLNFAELYCYNFLFFSEKLSLKYYK